MDFIKYCLFVSFFPQLIAGPIVRHNETIPQFCNNKFNSITYSNISISLSIFTIGLFKKVVLADGIAPYAILVFNAASRGETVYLIEPWCGALSYTFQLYFDFSGYSDMAIGLGRMFNVYLPLNFFSPYRCISIIDFWKRWHISLSLFLRDYLYVPLGGNRKGFYAKHKNLITTMLLGGLWHGAGWTFIAWGILHGLYLSINHSWRSILLKWNSYQAINDSTLIKTIYFVLTFLAVTIAWVFFRSDNIMTAQKILFGLFGLNGLNLPQGSFEILGPLGKTLTNQGVSFQSAIMRGYMFRDCFFWIFILSVITWCFPNTNEFLINFDSALNVNRYTNNNYLQLRWQPSVLWALILSIMFIACLLSMSSASEFLYFNF